MGSSPDSNRSGRSLLSSAVVGLAVLFLLMGIPRAFADSVVAVGPPSQSQATQYGAGKFIATLGKRVIAVLKVHTGSDRKARARALDRIVKTAFDVTEMARFAAGVYWRRTAPVNRNKYVDLFGKYVSHVYAAKFAKYQGQRFVIAGLRPSGNGVTAVRTLIVSDEHQTQIEFRVRRSDQVYRVIDVYVGGVSQLITERDEFNAVLAREGMTGLLQRLEAATSGTDQDT